MKLKFLFRCIPLIDDEARHEGYILYVYIGETVTLLRSNYMYYSTHRCLLDKNSWWVYKLKRVT